MSAMPLPSFLARPARRLVRSAATAALSLLLLAPLAGPLTALAQSQQPPPPTISINDFKLLTTPPVHARVLQWLQQGGDPNTAFGTDTFMHFIAGADNHIRILQEAVARGGNCDAKNGHGSTPLHVAASRRAPFGNDVEVQATRILLACGESQNAKDHYGDTPLHSVYKGVPDKGGAFVGHGNSWPEKSFGTSGEAGIHIAQALLEAGADPSALNRNREAPLMLVIRHPFIINEVEHVRLLLRYKADPNARDPEHNTLLIAALHHSPDVPIITALLKAGADPNARDRNGDTPLIHALNLLDGSYNNDDDETQASKVLTALLRAGADPDARDRNGDTALIHAVKHEYARTPEVRALLSGGADPCIPDRGGKFPAEHAEDENYWTAHKLIKKAGGDVHYETRQCMRDLAGVMQQEEALNLSSDDRKRIQTYLNAQNLDAGTPDGVFGPRTRTAIINWQRSKAPLRGNLPATGFLSREDMDLLAASYNPAPTPVCSTETDSGCWIELSNQPGCYIWHNYDPGHNHRHETTTWSGGCIEGKASGRGEIVWNQIKDGGQRTVRETGELRDSKGHGHWVVQWFPSGDVGEGPLRDGKQHGRWKFRNSDGDVWYACLNNGEQVDCQ